MYNADLMYLKLLVSEKDCLDKLQNQLPAVWDRLPVHFHKKRNWQVQKYHAADKIQ